MVVLGRMRGRPDSPRSSGLSGPPPFPIDRQPALLLRLSDELAVANYHDAAPYANAVGWEWHDDSWCRKRNPLLNKNTGSDGCVNAPVSRSGMTCDYRVGRSRSASVGVFRA